MRALLLVNPRSRRGRGRAAAIREELTRRGIEVVEARDAARGVDAVVVAGGDGTIVGQIGIALERDVPMGLVPLGTFNDLARTLAIPQTIAEACAVIAAGRTRRIDVARVNGVYYVNEASIGLSSRLTRLQKTSDKQRFGLGAILLSALRAFRYYRPFAAEISYDGITDRLRAIQITVANSHRFGGFIVVDGAAIDDGRLDCYAVEGRGFGPALALAAAIFRHEPPREGGVRAHRAAAFRIWTRGRHRISADGEPAGRTPAAFEVLPRALQIFVP